MPTLRPRNRASASSSSRPRSWPATVTVPESGRSSPAITISRVDLPEPDGPTSPTASPRAICRSMSLRIWTRAAPRPRARLMPVSAMAPAGPPAEVSFMWPFRARRAPLRPEPRSYGKRARPVQMLAIAAVAASLALVSAAAQPGGTGRPVKIVALGDSLTAGLGLPANAAFPMRLQQALAQKGVATDVVNAGVSGDPPADGLSRLDWSVPDDTDAVILELGANDALRGLDPAQTRANLDAILQRLTARRL